MLFISYYETKKASYNHITFCNHMERDRLPPLFSLPFLIIISSLTLRIWLFNPLHCLPIDTLIIFKTVTSVPMNTKETVRKIRKNSVENTARNLSICDNLAAGVFFRILAGKKTIFKRKRHVSGQNHLH